MAQPGKNSKGPRPFLRLECLLDKEKEEMKNRQLAGGLFVLTPKPNILFKRLGFDQNNIWHILFRTTCVAH